MLVSVLFLVHLRVYVSHFKIFKGADLYYVLSKTLYLLLNVNMNAHPPD